MKPSFALILSDDEIGLLHRTARGWLEIGQTRFDNPDLADALGYLRGSAVGLSPRGITTKLVIPNSQILYLDLDAPGPDAASRRKQIRSQLEGRTPYDVADLVFDWAGSGPTVQVAVVARETLEVAEGFAAEHRFNPLCFAAVPPEGVFGKEPWFGPSAMAASLLPEGEKVERDQAPIVIVARDVPRASEPAAVAAAAPPPEPVAEAAPVAEPAPFAEPAKAAEPEPVSPTPAEPMAKPEPVAAPPEPAQVAAPVATAAPVPPAPPAPAAPPVAPAPVAAALAEPAPAAVAPAAPARAAEAPATPARSEPAPPAVAAPAVTPPAPPAKPPAPAPAAKPAAASVLSATLEDAPAKPAAAKPGVPGGVPDAPFIDVVDAAPEPPAPLSFSSRRAADAPPPLTATGASFTAPKPGKAGAPAVEAPRPAAGRPAGAAVARPVAPVSKPVVTAAAVTAPSIPGGRGRKAVKPIAKPSAPPAAGAQPAAGGASTMGGFGARQLPQRGKPRYLGLILTGALLLFLALVAAWSSFYIANRSDAPATTGTAALDAPEADDLALADADATITAPDALPLPETAAPAIEDEMLADLQDPADFVTDPGGADAAPPDATATAAPEAEVPVAAAPLAEPAPVAEVAQPAPALPASATDSPTARPLSEAQDEIFLATMDAPLRQLDALALPSPRAVSDALPQPQMPPPPFGTVYQFDAAGLIVPTAEGIITPEGYTLIAGAPPKLPPARPAAITAAAPAAIATPEAPIPEATAAAEPAPVADPALAGARPRTRPADLVPPPAQAEDDAALTDAAATRVTSRRPQARPASIFAQAEEAARADAEAALVLASVSVPAANANPLLVTVSRKPAARPKDFTKAVEAAVAAAVRQPDPAPPVEEPAQRAEPEADAEPEVVAAAAPRIPTRASVAKQATFTNAINLSQINLIGVYGTSAKRYALVRQANGRYRKVAVGDKVDGGRVAAITASELRYQKGSKMVTLAMPEG